MKRRSIISFALVAILLCTFFVTPAYALTVPNFTCFENNKSDYVVSTSERKTSNGTLIFDGMAKSNPSLTFNIMLQKKVLGIWVDAGVAIHTSQSHSGTTRHERLGENLQGQYFRVTWKGLNTSSTYRVVLRCVSLPYRTEIYETRIDIQ